jgi:hypothetical protein
MKQNLKQTVKLAELLLLIFLAASACKKKNQDSRTLSRSEANGKFFAVGLVTYENMHRCTATIIKHGVALTAKHCFQTDEIEQGNLRKLGLNFRYASDNDVAPLFVHGNQIKKIIFDGSSNDIAYILYEPSATSRLKLDLPLAKNPSSPAKAALTAIVGFPVEEKITPQFPKVVSKDCSFTGKSGYIKPPENDSGYDGLLFETTCEGWSGMSGGPSIAFTGSKGSEIIGVVTHTFHLTATGEIDNSQIKADTFSSYIRDVVISPLSQAEQLKQILALDLDRIPTPSSALDVKALCGYDNSSSLLAEARTAVEFLKNSDAFDPLFWVAPGNSSDLLTVLRDAIKTENKALKDNRNTAETSIPWAKDVFADYDALLNSPNLAKFKSLDIAHLGITESYQACDTVACTDYGSFAVAINKDATAAIFSKLTSDAARKTMKAVLSHELGHYILDFYLLKGKGYASLEEAMKEEGSLSYHLTVDAIGIVLGGISKTEFADVLNNSLTSEIFGDRRLIADSADRVMCMTKLK